MIRESMETVVHAQPLYKVEHTTTSERKRITNYIKTVEILMEIFYAFLI